MQFKDESRIDALGRVFFIRVFDKLHFPFEVYFRTPDGSKYFLQHFDYRADAILFAANSAVEWIQSK